MVIHIRNTYMPFGLHQVNMLHVKDHAYHLHMYGLWDDEEWAIINAYVEMYIQMENAPMPSGMRFLSPLSAFDGDDRWVYFPELCHDIEYDFEFTRLAQVQEGSHIIFDDEDYDEDATIPPDDISDITDVFPDMF